MNTSDHSKDESDGGSGSMVEAESQSGAESVEQQEISDPAPDVIQEENITNTALQPEADDCPDAQDALHNEPLNDEAENEPLSAVNAVSDSLEFIARQITALAERVEAFDRYQEVDRRATSQREEIIARLHSDLGDARSGMDKKMVIPIFRAIAHVIDEIEDDIRRIQASVDSGSQTQNPADLIDEHRKALLIALSRFGLDRQSRFEADELVGNAYDTRAMQVAETISSDDSSLHATVEKVISPGYYYETKILIPPRVNIYRYTDSQPDPEVE